MPITTILFDVDGTLLDFKRAEANALDRLQGFAGSPLDAREFLRLYEEVNHKIWQELEEGLLSAAELKIERFRRFARAAHTAKSPDALSEYYQEALGQGSYPLAESRELLQCLKGRFKLGIITNGLVKVQNPRHKAAGFDQIFDTILISEEEGVSKPDPEIFRRAARRLNTPLDDRVLMVGDSLVSDIQGGIRAGVKTCWYNPGGWPNESPWKSDWEIRNLMELTKRLGI